MSTKHPDQLSMLSVSDKCDAMFSEDRRYRYTLTRTWDESKLRACFLLLNPSIATEKQLDPTLTRCFGFARALGYGSMIVLNLFAIIGTDPAILTELGEAESIGPLNDAAIMSAACDARTGIVIAGFGAEPIAQARGAIVVRNIALVRDVYALGLTKSGAPRHPLYLRGDARPVLYRAKIAAMVASECGCDPACTGALCANEMAAKAAACGLSWDEIAREA